VPPIFLREQARQSLWISVPRHSLGTSYVTRSQALPGNTDAEAVPPIFLREQANTDPEAVPPIFLREQARQSLCISVPRHSLGTSYVTRSQALPGNTDPEAVLPIFLREQARQSLWISVPRHSLGTS